MQTRKRRVFCAEDHDDTRQLLSLLLGQSDYEVEAAKTVKEGLRLARRKRFDLYLLSGKFPDGDGIEMCRDIRRFDTVTPILFFSAAAHETDRQSGIEAGAQGYIAKPGDIFELVKAITQLINQSKHTAGKGYGHQ